MGAGAVSKEQAITMFDKKYQRERADLRKELIQSFVSNPNNHDITEKISLIRTLLIQHSHICATAEREAATAADKLPTSMQAAYHELDRLIAIYETSTILKSAQCRISHIACPLGHCAGYMDSFKHLGSKDKPALCNMCDKVVPNGYHCGYCEYSLCIPCSTIYCCNGHAMKLWTHPESELSCIVCNKVPISSGYMCIVCDDYNICDYCTWKDGRKVVQQVILDRIADDLAYLVGHQSESETAFRTVSSHSMKVTSNSYPTTKHLFDFSVTMQQIKEVAVLEVRQTRLTNAILALRAELTAGKDFSRVAYVESLVTDTYTTAELDRLQKLKQWSDDLKSTAMRCCQPIACPLGHTALPYSDNPPPFQVPGLSLEESTLLPRVPYEETPLTKKIANLSAVCKVCDRLATSAGAHCMYCDYTLCSICAVIYCKKGHRMQLWTEPSALETCFLCHKADIIAGYRCKECDVDVCDICTTKQARNQIRTDWEAEMGNLLGFMKTNRRSSDIAMFYQWRHANHVVSLGLLVDYVQELRTAKTQAIKQIDQKPLIDQIKAIRAEITKHPELSATAAREASRNEANVFPSKKKAAKELNRLAGVLKEMILVQAPEKRTASGIACPLAHAMDLLPAMCMLPAIGGTGIPNIQQRRQQRNPIQPLSEVDIDVDDDVATEDVKLHTLPPITPSGRQEMTRLQSLKGSVLESRSMLESSMNSVAIDFTDSPFSTQQQRCCSVCDSKDLASGHICSICEYYLCTDCSVVYCRMGHRTKIWTLHEAHCMECDVCKKCPITSGYRCMTCQVDICDLCTTREARNAFLLWPRREFQRLLSSLEQLQKDSPIARQFVSSVQEREKGFMDTMSKMCKALQEAQLAKAQADDEVKQKISSNKGQRYGMFKSREML